jgi:nucleoside-diphosphate-sugar epimerase
MQGRTALVTGATGFVGRHLTRRLASEGWVVHAVVRQTSNLGRLGDASKAIRVHIHDGTTGGMLRIMRSATPETVFHLAAMSSAQHAPGDLEKLLQSNLIFATQLSEAAAAQGVRCFVNTGTHWQHYGSQEHSPVSLYAACKTAFESILRYYAEARGVRTVTLVLFDTYGPDDDRPKLLKLLRNAVETGNPVAMTAGEQTINLVHVADVAEAYCVAASRLHTEVSPGYERYAVRSREPTMLRDVVRMFGEACGRSVPVKWGALQYRQREIMTPWHGGEDLPGWSPRISLKDGLKRLVDE